MAGAVVHFEIPADDVERARAFYRDAFGGTSTRCRRWSTRSSARRRPTIRGCPPIAGVDQRRHVRARGRHLDAGDHDRRRRHRRRVDEGRVARRQDGAAERGRSARWASPPTSPTARATSWGSGRTPAERRRSRRCATGSSCRGLVQGVWFRESCRREAERARRRRLGAPTASTARSRPCSRGRSRPSPRWWRGAGSGPPRAEVTGVDVSEEPPEGAGRLPRPLSRCRGSAQMAELSDAGGAWRGPSRAARRPGGRRSGRSSRRRRRRRRRPPRRSRRRRRGGSGSRCGRSA